MFRKILIANRGEIACRIVRTCRRLGIATIAVYSDADARALHVALADEAVRLGPAPVRDSYLNARAIVEAARSTGADAIHPGYGLLSENASFARAAVGAGLVFIGPPPAVLEAFGDKLKARKVALSAGVAPVPGLVEPLPGDPVAAVAAARAEGDRLGYPLLVKAVGGGGGIGMQTVTEPEGLERAIKTCSDRGKAAFGDERVYLERCVRRPRHIEVQVLCDTAGNAVSLGERECSVQRRHQKIIEESPSPIFAFDGARGYERRRELEEAALRVAREAGYVGAGTCEFIADEAGAFFFLEVNARLQVEHPVTEMRTDLDLVECQLRVAAGEPLPPSAVGVDVAGVTGVVGGAGVAGGAGAVGVNDVNDVNGGEPGRGPVRRGHAIEARVYAEDPAKSFAPQPGRLARLAWPAASDELRIETGVREGDDVTPYYDPLLAKVIAWGKNRAEATARLDAALASTVIDLVGPRGPAATNLAYLRRILASDAFASGQYDTGLVGSLGPAAAGTVDKKGRP